MTIQSPDPIGTDSISHSFIFVIGQDWYDAVICCRMELLCIEKTNRIVWYQSSSADIEIKINQWTKLQKVVLHLQELNEKASGIRDELRWKSTYKDGSTEVRQTDRGHLAGKVIAVSPKNCSQAAWLLRSRAGYLRTIGELDPWGLWRLWLQLERGRVRWVRTDRHNGRSKGSVNLLYTDTSSMDRHSITDRQTDRDTPGCEWYQESSTKSQLDWV